MSFADSMSSLSRFTQDLRKLPRRVGTMVAEKAAPAITALAMQTFNASEDPDGVSWAPGANGQAITLRKTGALARYVHYVAIGTKLRVALGVSYAKYQIGRRRVFPTQGARLPEEYVRALRRIAVEVCRAELGGRS